MFVIEVKEIRRGPTLGFLIAPTKDYAVRVNPIAPRRFPKRAPEVFLIDSKDVAAQTGNRLKLLSSGKTPGLTVMTCSMEAALPGPPSTGQAVDTLKERESTYQRHGDL